MAKLVKRINHKEPEKPTKSIEEVKIGDAVVINGFQFTITKIDTLSDRICLVDKYACDYYIKKGEKVEIVS